MQQSEKEECRQYAINTKQILYIETIQVDSTQVDGFLVYSLIFVLLTESNQANTKRNVWHYTSFLWYPRALTIASHFPL